VRNLGIYLSGLISRDGIYTINDFTTMPDTLDKPGKPDNFRLYEQRLRRLFCRGFESDFALRASPEQDKELRLHPQTP